MHPYAIKFPEHEPTFISSASQLPVRTSSVNRSILLDKQATGKTIHAFLS